jgi:hypothetical protein
VGEEMLLHARDLLVLRLHREGLVLQVLHLVRVRVRVKG